MIVDCHTQIWNSTSQLGRGLGSVPVRADEHRHLQSVEPVDKASVRDRLPEVAYRSYDSFTHCPGCDKLYWQGGHYDRILARVADLMKG